MFGISLKWKKKSAGIEILIFNFNFFFKLLVLLLVCTEVNSELCSSVERKKLVFVLRPNSSKRPKRPTGSMWNARSRSWNRYEIPGSYNFTTLLTTARKRFVFCLNCKSRSLFNNKLGTRGNFACITTGTVLFCFLFFFILGRGERTDKDWVLTAEPAVSAENDACLIFVFVCIFPFFWAPG